MTRFVEAALARFCGRCDGGRPLALMSEGATSFVWECVTCGHRYPFVDERPPERSANRSGRPKRSANRKRPAMKRVVVYSFLTKYPERVQELAYTRPTALVHAARKRELALEVARRNAEERENAERRARIAREAEPKIGIIGASTATIRLGRHNERHEAIIARCESNEAAYETALLLAHPFRHVGSRKWQLDEADA